MYHGNRKMHVMAAIAISLDRISIGIVVQLITISLDHALIDVNSGVNSGCNGGFDDGLDGWFHLAVLGYQPQKSIQQLRREAFMAISQEGLMGLS